MSLKFNCSWAVESDMKSSSMSSSTLPMLDIFWIFWIFWTPQMLSALSALIFIVFFFYLITTGLSLHLCHVLVAFRRFLATTTLCAGTFGCLKTTKTKTKTIKLVQVRRGFGCCGVFFVWVWSSDSRSDQSGSFPEIGRFYVIIMITIIPDAVPALPTTRSVNKFKFKHN